MIARFRIISILLTIIFCSSCSVKNPMPTTLPTMLQTEPNQPEPQQPLIEGRISGIDNDDLVTILMKTPTGDVATRVSMRGNGDWQAVRTEASGSDYIISAEAEGYVSSPISYNIHLIDLNAYIVLDGQVTEQKANNINFHFEPVSILPTNTFSK